jgi:hypothetical protein
MSKKNYLLRLSLALLLLFSFSVVVSADQLTLKSGETLNGEVVNSSIKIKTSYAELNLESGYLIRIEKKEEAFSFQAVENNKFTGELLTALQFRAAGETRTFEPEALTSVYFTDRSSFNANQQASLTLKNGDFFFASTVRETISLNTSLGSTVDLSFNDILEIEYLVEEDLYLIRRRSGSELKADLAEKKLIIWPAAAEIIELDLSYLQRLSFD